MTDGDLISRKAVIDGINAYIEKAQYSGTIDDFISFEELVVKSLPAVKPLKKEQTDGDLISRQATIDALSHMCSEDGNGITVSRANVNSMLKAMPPVTPKPKIWRWIDEGFYAEGHSEHAYRCSKCDEHYIGYMGEFKCCPNCGAKMRESEKEE